VGIADLVFPKKCLVCKSTGDYVCRKCLARVSKVEFVCVGCFRPSIDGMTHQKCKKPHGMDAMISIWSYKGVIRSALKTLKYKYVSEIAGELANQIIAEFAAGSIVFPRKILLVPIPLSRSRENWRGFNQAQMLGKLLAQKMKWGYADLLVRTKNTRTQTGLDKKSRQKNVKGIFAVNNDYLSKTLAKDYNVLILDDVWTTGATMKEATKVLKRNKIPVVWGLTVAR